MASTVNIEFNISGNFSSAMSEMTEATGRLAGEVDTVKGYFARLSDYMVGFNNLSDVMSKLADGINQSAQSGIALDKAMRELEAISNVTGDKLQLIETYARESAKAFGTDAAESVKAYQNLLGQLSPEIAKYPEALRAMGESVQITSKLMGNDGVAAAEVLTTAMNQYGVDLSDPIEASRKMAEMMNVMAKAGQEGSAELPTIKLALENAGMAAKAANMSFEETNAAIQVLDKAGKKGAEGGVALRNVLAQIGQGRFTPKLAREAMQKAGIDVVKLADQSKSLKERLEMLSPLLKDSALLSEFFGKENANAAMALIGNTEELGRLTEAVTGSNSAVEQADIIMQSYEERQARVNQQMEDFKISIFQATGDLSLWMGVAAEALIPISQLMPLIMGLGSMMSWIVGLRWGDMWRQVQRWIYVAQINTGLFNKELRAGQVRSLGFRGNILRAAWALVRFATVGIFNALKGIGAYILSLVTGGTASVGFASVASASFTAFKASAVSACRAVSVAIMNIPLVGWILAAIAALIALGVYFWNTSAKFRAILLGMWAAIKAFFTGLTDAASHTFSALGELIQAAFDFDGKGMQAALGKLQKGFSDYGKKIGGAFSEAYNAEIERSAKEEKKGKEKEDEDPMAQLLAEAGAIPLNTPTTPTDKGGGGGGVTDSSAGKGKGSGGGSSKNITITIDKLVERFEIHTTNLQGDISRVQEMVTQALLGAVNDANLAV